MGGHKISDQNMAINQAKTWHALFEMIKSSQFTFSQDVALALHAIAAKDEALVAGQFRTGYVTIAGSDYMPPVATVFTQM